MNPPRRQFLFGFLSRTRFSWVALLLVFTLVSHVFESCTTHFGFPQFASAVEVLTDCAHIEAVSCDSCSLHSHHESDADNCDSQSEIAVLTSSFSPDQLVFNFSTIAVLPAPQHLVALESGSLHGYAEPPPSHFVSSSLRSSLPNRAPPLA